MCENAYFSIKNPKASRALKRALDPGRRMLASLVRLRFATSATFGLRSWGPPPWPNPGSAPAVTVKSYLMDSNRLYLENPLKLPTLYIYSHNDKVAKPDTILDSLACQKKRNVPVFTHEFDTPHVQHFRYYPEQYVKLLDDFIDFIKIRNFEYSSDNLDKMMLWFCVGSNAIWLLLDYKLSGNVRLIFMEPSFSTL